MKRWNLIALVTTVFLLFTSMQVSAETTAERLNRLEQEIQALKEKESGSVWSKYNMRLYGRVKVDLNYDTAQFTRYNDFLGVIEEDGGNDSTNFNPRDTRLGFEASHTDGNWTGKGRFEIDFYGANNVNNLIPRMRLGYVDIANNSTGTSLRIGQDWIPVAQLNPPTIDFGLLSAAGNLWWRIPQVTLRQKMGDAELLVSAMKHRRQSTREDDRMPWALGRISYAMGKGGLIALGGGYRTETDDTTDKEIDRWLSALELKFTTGPITLCAEGWWGEAIGDEFLRYDMDLNDSDPTDPNEIESRGGFVSLIAKATEKLSFSGGYGIDDPKNDDMEGMQGTLNDRQFTKNEIAFLNTWYSITKGVKVGAEVEYVKTERFDNTDRGARYTLSAFYAF